MRIDTALLCDWVTVRENLLHILGGGITRINRPQYPAPLGAALALRIMLHRTEVDRMHDLEVVLADQDGQTILKIDAQFQVPREALATLTPNEEVTVNLPLGMQGMLIPRDGAYAFDILIDRTHAASIPFQAVVVPTAPPPAFSSGMAPPQ